jgi:predicted MFS family arabinose efflux permease
MTTDVTPMSGVANRSDPPAPPTTISVWRAALSGFSASLVGIGLARFAYTPLLPAIIAAHWFDPSAATYLGAANLAGYLAGALLARPLAARVPARLAINAMMVLTTASFFACATPVSVLWFFLWRFASGLSGGALMVLAAPTVLPHIPPSRRGLVGGVIFMGVGAGIAASGTLVPLLLRQGLTGAWLGLGALSLALTLIAWGGWPASPPAAPAGASHRKPRAATALRALYGEYGLAAIGLVPHMVFLVDFVARGLGQGLQTGAEYWVLFGFGAMVGPILAGYVADRTGFGPALRLTFLVQALAVAVPVMGLGAPSLILSSLIVGAFVPGVVTLALGRIHELLAHHPSEQQAAWGVATTSFAVLQALAAYGMSYLLVRSGDYRLLFLLGSGALMLALAIDLIAALGNRPTLPTHARPTTPRSRSGRAARR